MNRAVAQMREATGVPRVRVIAIDERPVLGNHGGTALWRGAGRGSSPRRRATRFGVK
jgi:hypothetical protein